MKTHLNQRHPIPSSDEVGEFHFRSPENQKRFERAIEDRLAYWEGLSYAERVAICEGEVVVV